jgi:hypothetical protein
MKIISFILRFALTRFFIFPKDFLFVDFFLNLFNKSEKQTVNLMPKDGCAENEVKKIKKVELPNIMAMGLFHFWRQKRKWRVKER